ncbi:MAG: L,D-transpeptidase [Verrucomicrobia bacterium]|nr:L,D-transpeptidase [Verrucomicrobiota bacterium]
MKQFLPILLLPTLFLGGCAQLIQRSTYDQPAYKPKDSSKVVVKVSLSKQMVYVMEGNRPLLVTACCVGMPSKPTPKGNLCVTRKERNKRSGSYGFAVMRDAIVPCEAGSAKGRYVGYPMPYWVEFAPGYGFHQGWVWPTPKTHGCIRLHANDAGDFWELTRVGTPVKIANTQPEDATLGAKTPRPQDYNDPDLPNGEMTSPSYFQKIKAAVLQ